MTDYQRLATPDLEGQHRSSSSSTGESNFEENSKKTVVFLRTSSTARIPVYHYLAKVLGYRLIMIHPVVVEDFASSFYRWIEVETTDTSVVERSLRAAMEEDPAVTPSAIISFDEYGVYPAAVLAERFGFRPLPLPPTGLRVTSIKSQFRQWCAEHNIRAPKAVALRSPDVQVAERIVAEDVTFPVVVKLSPGASSIMTKRCENLSELEQYVRSMWTEIEVHPLRAQWEAIGTKCHILVEEFIGGQEVDIDCVVENGQLKFCVISDNFDPIPPYFQEQGGRTPSTLHPSAQQDLKQLLESYLRSHGSQVHGVLHFEAKYDSSRRSATDSTTEAPKAEEGFSGKSYVIEVNVRPGSAETHTMVHSVYGVTLGECVVRLALGQPLAPLRLSEKEDGPKMCCASVNVYPTREGVLVSSSIDQTLPGFIRFVPCAPGSAVAPPPKSFGMLAWLVASGNSSEEAQENLKRIMQSISFRMRDATVLEPDSVEHEASPSK